VVHGRGTDRNPPNRYDELHVELDDEARAEAGPTRYFRDASKSVLAENDSPDVGFRYSVNPYRGCEHGCVYCYARPSHQYLGFSAGLDFERRIMVKDDAPALLRQAFQRSHWQGEVVAFSGNTDCYQPVERHLHLTRQCLEVCAEFGNPVGVITKSALVARDVDVLARLAGHQAAQVFVSLTTLDDDLAARMEPRAARPARRLDALRALAAGGVPVGVLLGPVVPGLTDREIPRLLETAAAAGARTAGWTLLRLPPPVDALVQSWLEAHYPERAQHVLGRIRDTRGGALTDARFGRRHRGEGAYAEQIAQLFAVSARKCELDRPLPELSSAAFRRPDPAGQLRLW
jgi:DNA repair photolyase